MTPGSPDEGAALAGQVNTTVDAGSRRAEAGGRWTYRFATPAGARLALRFSLEGEVAVAVAGANGKPLPSRTERAGSERAVIASAPPDHPAGGRISFRFKAESPAAISDLRLEILLPDSNGDGISDMAEQLMGAAPGSHPSAVPRPPIPHTSFQTGLPWSPEIAVPADAALVYSADEKVIRSWAERGYAPQTMGGFREGGAYAREHPDEVQTDRDGKPITIGADGYYLIPTAARIQAAQRYYAAALAGGATAICPEEPEIFSRAGYSDSFKREWQARYGEPWQPPHGRIDLRYKAEQLKAYLTTRQIEAILADARRLKPSATRMLAVHSPVTYYQWGIPVPHYALLNLPDLQELIGQVWTGTAQSPARSAGVRAHRTFEVGYLEYSSLYHLARGSGRRLWFLVDPVEDRPGRPIDEYRKGYRDTLLAALMFPAVDSFEVMPWPQRVFGRVPADYATEINTLTGVLSDLWRFPAGDLDSGSPEIGTFVSDSMGWQRADPAESDYDGFYGLCLPLVQHGVPVQALSLDRAAEPGYLDRAKLLLVSYDFLKPASEAANRALADWVSRGGSLLLAGGSDAYNALPDSWWRKAGRNSPVQDLLARFGAPLSAPRTISPSPNDPAAYRPLLQSQQDGVNRRAYTVDLTPFAQESGSVMVRFEDATPSDGEGAFVASAELRIGGKLAASFRAGSEIETRFLAEESGTIYSGQGRFADRGGHWTYRFDNLPRAVPVTLTVDMGQGFKVSARSGGPRPTALEAADHSFGRVLDRVRVPAEYPITLTAPPPGARALYTLPGESAPAVWEAGFGKGTVLYSGASPAAFSATAVQSRWLRALARHALQKAGPSYREQAWFRVKRGPYAAVRALGREVTVDGRWVDLFSPTLNVVEDPIVPPGGQALFQEFAPESPSPRLAAVSGRLHSRLEIAKTTGWVVQAPSGTSGAARLFAGKRRAQGVKAFTLLGKPLPATITIQGDTVLARYPNDSEGVIVRVGWQ